MTHRVSLDFGLAIGGYCSHPSLGRTRSPVRQILDLGKACQDCKNYNFRLTDCSASKNNFCKVGGITPCKMLY